MAGLETREVTSVVPDGWGSDDLTKFFDALHENVKSSFVHLSDYFGALVQIDQVLLKMAQMFPLLAEPHQKDAVKLIGRSLGSFRAAAQLALEGRPTECMPLVRQCLECTGYAVIIANAEAAARLWADRRSLTALIDCVRSTHER